MKRHYGLAGTTGRTTPERIPQRLAWLAIVGMLAGGTGCGPQPMTPEASRLLTSGIEAYDSGNDLASLAHLDLFLRNHSRTQRADEAHYYRGLAHYNLGHVLVAREDFHRVMARTQLDQLRGKAMIALGNMSYDDGDMSAAEGMYIQSLVNLQRSLPPRGLALLRLGKALQRQSRWPEADRYFNQLIGDFPATSAARQAAGLVNAQYWTVQVDQFENISDAKELAASLGQGDLTANLRRRMIEGKLITHVQVGLHSAYEQAKQQLPQVLTMYPQAFLTVTQ